MAKIYNSLAEWETAVKVYHDNDDPITEHLAAQEQRLRDLEKEKSKTPIYSKLEDISKFKPYSEVFKKCVNDTVEQLLDNSENAKQPGLLLGKIQCGKTNTFVNIIGYAFDRGIDVAVVFTKGTNALATQTTARLKKEFAVFARTERITGLPVVEVYDIKDLKGVKLTTDEINTQHTIIVCKKEDDNLAWLTKRFTEENPILRTKKTIIIDDEADFASINFFKKEGHWHSAVVTQQIQDFIDIPEYCRYLPVTATPYALFLQPNDVLNLENGVVKPFVPRFTTIVPTHDKYIGGQQYFTEAQDPESMYSHLYYPVSDVCINKLKTKHLAYKNKILTLHKIDGFRRALLTYMMAAVIRKIQTEGELNYRSSCILHLDVTIDKHDWQYMLTNEFFDKIKEQLNGEPIAEISEMMQSIYEDFRQSNEAGNNQGLINLRFPDYATVIDELRKALNNEKYVINLVNSNQSVENLLNDNGQLKLKTLMNVFIGGSILDRGITIENMLCFFYGRIPQKFQQDTVLQHARMYGSRSKEDMSVTRLFTTPEIYEVMQKMNDLDESLRQQIEEGVVNKETPTLRYLDYVGGRIVPCSRTKIAISNTLTIKPGSRCVVTGFQTGPKTQIAQTIKEIDNIITSTPGYKQNEIFEIETEAVVDIIHKIRSTYVYDEQPDRQWQNYGLDWNENDMISTLAWCTRKTGGTMLCLHHTGLNASRFRKDDPTKFMTAPDTGRTDLKLARESAIDKPVIILLREEGTTEQGWRGTPFYWPVLVAQQNIHSSYFTLDNNKKKKEYIPLDHSIIADINPEEMLSLTLEQMPFDDIESGEKIFELRNVRDTTASTLLEKSKQGDFILSPDTDPSALTAGFNSLNNGIFPFVPKKFKYLHFRTSRDGKANQMLVELNPEKPVCFGYSRPKRMYVTDVLKKNHEITGFSDDTFVNWWLVYNIRPIRVHRYGETLRFITPKPFNDPGELNLGMLWDEEEIKTTDENGDSIATAETQQGYSTDEIIAHNNNITVIDIPEIDNQNSMSLCMPIDGVYWIEGRKGYLLSGTVESGQIELGDTIYLSNGLYGVVDEFDNNAAIATPGDKVGILVSGIKKGELDGVENLIVQ